MKVKTLIKIKKKLDKCDSLKVRYSEKSIVLNNLILSNEKNGALLIEERALSKQHLDKIAEINKELKKEKKNQIKAIVVTGVVVAVLVKVFASK